MVFSPISMRKLNIIVPGRHEALSIRKKQPLLGCFMGTSRSDLASVARLYMNRINLYVILIVGIYIPEYFHLRGLRKAGKWLNHKIIMSGINKNSYE